VVNIASTSTAAASSTLTGLNIAISGANGTTAQTVTGEKISVTNTNGTSGTNIGLQSTASGATTQNLAGLFVGDVAFGGTTSSFPVLRNRSGIAQIEVLVGGGGTVNRGAVWGLGYIATSANVGTYTGSLYVDGSNGYYKLGSTGEIRFMSTTDAVSGTADTGLTRSQAATIRVQGAAATNPGTFSTVALTPAQIKSDQNNYAPGTGWFQRWSSDASRNVTGLAAGVDGQVVEIWNVGAQNIVLQNQNASSTAANRFLTSTGADLTLAADKCAEGRYDATTARWRVRLCN
jgi:hypothetical protein